MQILIECIDPLGERADSIRAFYGFVADKLGIVGGPRISFTQHLGTTSFGLYSPSDDNITVAVEGRHISDILRTFAHELVHHVQLTHDDQPSDRSIEDLEWEANAIAGMLMRDYNKLHPELFGLSVAVEPPTDTLGDSQGATFPDPTRPSGPIEMAEAKIKETDSDALTMLKLGNQALRAFPSSPRQREIQKQIEALRKKMKRERTPEYHTTLNEDGIVNSAGSGAVAGIGIGPQGEPGVSPNKKKSPIMGPMRLRKTFKQLKEELS